MPERKSTDLRIRDYMVGHKGVTFQSMARAVGLSNADALYDLVNNKSVSAKVRKRVDRWLDDHERDPEKIRY